MVTCRAIADRTPMAALQTLPALLLFGICLATAALASKLTPRWREWLAAGLALYAILLVSLPRKAPAADAAAAAHAYYAPAALLGVAAIAVFAWDRWRRTRT